MKHEDMTLQQIHSDQVDNTERQVSQYIITFNEPDTGQTQIHTYFNDHALTLHTDSTIFSQIDEKDADKIGPDKLT